MVASYGYQLNVNASHWIIRGEVDSPACFGPIHSKVPSGMMAHAVLDQRSAHCCALRFLALTKLRKPICPSFAAPAADAAAQSTGLGGRISAPAAASEDTALSSVSASNSAPFRSASATGPCLRPPRSHHRAHRARVGHGLACRRSTRGQQQQQQQQLLLLLRPFPAGDEGSGQGPQQRHLLRRRRRMRLRTSRHR